MGEGWGLTSTEHAITGAPQLVPDHSACRELFEDCGVLLKTRLDYTFDNSQTVGRLTSPEDVAEGLELVYNNPELRQELEKKTLQKFLQPEYQWQIIARQWGEIFKEVCK
jgi:glycosyltransferase involved in cell wall biosynthesis